MSKDVMITTEDNPYDYFTQFEEWFRFDVQNGYHTCEFIDRLMVVYDGQADSYYENEHELAINRILELNLTGNYKKVYRKGKEKEAKEKEAENHMRDALISIPPEK